MNMLESLIQEHVEEVLYKDPMEICLNSEELMFMESSEVNFLYSLMDESEELCGVGDWVPKFEELPRLEGKPLPSSVQLPTLELKPFP